MPMQAFRRLSSLTSHLLPQEDTEFDYVIVGGGTVGCVLANRLTEDAGPAGEKKSMLL